jgi:hypothetical protein
MYPYASSDGFTEAETVELRTMSEIKRFEGSLQFALDLEGKVPGNVIDDEMEKVIASGKRIEPDKSHKIPWEFLGSPK